MSTVSLSPPAWYDLLPKDKPWSTLWSGYTLCGYCRGIHASENPCNICGKPLPSFEPGIVQLADGREVALYSVSMGAEGRYEDYVYLNMIEREWKRPVLDTDHFLGFSSEGGPSARASIVILFWSYFETRIERLLRTALSEVPARLLDDTLRRYSSIGARLNEFYRIAFASTYKDDLEDVGYGTIWPRLVSIQEKRNLFAHGQPQAIDEALVQSTVEMIKTEHEAWIAVFNKRAAFSK